MEECERCLLEAVNAQGICTECGYNKKENAFEAIPEKEDLIEELDKKLDNVKPKRKPDSNRVGGPSALEQALVNKILDFKIKIGNPSAWDRYSEEGSEMLRALLDIVEGRDPKEVKKPEGKRVYQEGEDISLKGLLVGQVITDIEGDDLEVKIKTKEHTLHVEANGSEGSRLLCNMKVPVQTVKEVQLTL